MWPTYLEWVTFSFYHWCAIFCTVIPIIHPVIPFLLQTNAEYLVCLLDIFNIICGSLCIATTFIPSSFSFIYRTEEPLLIVS